MAVVAGVLSGSASPEGLNVNSPGWNPGKDGDESPTTPKGLNRTGETTARGFDPSGVVASSATNPRVSPGAIHVRSRRERETASLAAFQLEHPSLARLLSGLGSEFMPPLNEGSLLFMPVLLPSTSLTEVKRIMAWQDKVISQIPEVASVAGKLGRSETATDPAPVEMIETTILLKPEHIVTNRTLLGFIKIPRTIRNPEWRAGLTLAQVQSELSQKLTQVPGYAPGFLQPIENRILILSTGIRAQVGVKINTKLQPAKTAGRAM